MSGRHVADAGRDSLPLVHLCSRSKAIRLRTSEDQNPTSAVQFLKDNCQGWSASVFKTVSQGTELLLGERNPYPRLLPVPGISESGFAIIKEGPNTKLIRQFRGLHWLSRGPPNVEIHSFPRLLQPVTGQGFELSPIQAWPKHGIYPTRKTAISAFQRAAKLCDPSISG